MLEFLKRAAEKNAFNPGWTCAYCGREIFDGGYFCRECAEKLPLNDGEICAHCGRELDAPQDYCYTCAGRLTAFDAGRSAFVYEGIVSALIRKFKYGNARYLAKVFAPYLANVYYGSFAAADAVAYVPMLKKDQRKRGFNQTELLAREFCADRAQGDIGRGKTPSHGKTGRSRQGGQAEEYGKHVPRRG